MEELLLKFPYAYEMAAASFVGNVCNTVWSDGNSTMHWVRRVIVGFLFGIAIGGFIASKLGGGMWDFIGWVFVASLFTEIFMELIPKWLRARSGNPDILPEKVND